MIGMCSCRNVSKSHSLLSTLPNDSYSPFPIGKCQLHVSVCQQCFKVMQCFQSCSILGCISCIQTYSTCINLNSAISDMNSFLKIWLPYGLQNKYQKLEAKKRNYILKNLTKTLHTCTKYVKSIGFDDNIPYFL